MAGSVNKVIIIGNLGADPEGRDTGGGRVVSLRIATNRKWQTKQGERKEETEWHSVVLWTKLAELAERYLRKGQSVYIEGRLQTRDWVDKESGQKRYRTEIVAQEMTFLGGGDEPARPAARHTARTVARTDGPRQVAGTGAAGPGTNPYDDDEIPF